MKKNKLVMSAIITLFIIITSLPAYSTPTVRLEVNPAITVGDTFSLDVFIDGVTDFDPFLGVDEILAFGFDIVSDPSFTYNGATVGAGFMDDSGFFPDTEVAGSAFPGVSGDNIALASLSFTATMAGDFALGIFSDMLDLNEGLFTWLSFDPLDITTSTNVAVSAVPEPASLMLVGVGLIGIGIIRKKGVGFGH